jgi:protein-S-isoprenylcysteine O-methyltransferase Ste14
MEKNGLTYMIKEHERQLVFLQTLILLAEPAEGQRLVERLQNAEREERSIRRAIYLMVLIAALSFSILGYAAVLLPEFLTRASSMALVFSGGCVGSLISLTVFLFFWFWYRQTSHPLHEECRRFVVRGMKTRLGKQN